MTIFSNILDAITGGTSGAVGGIASTAMTAIEKYFPPSMSEQDKANVQLALDNMELQKAVQVQAQISAAEKEVDDRIAMYEGSASDLKGIPYLGAFMLFLRGSQRPVWGFVVMYLDYGVFSGMWKLTDPVVSNAFWILNFLVLGFLFGERAVMNVMPFITNMIAVKNQAPQDISVTTIKK